MTRNYDTTTHKPYPRITEVNIEYAESGRPAIEYVERMAIVDGDGKVRHIDSGAKRHTLDLAAVTKLVQVVYLVTGELIPGQTVTSQQLMLGLLAFLRADQL